MTNTTITAAFPNTIPTLIDTAWFQYRGKAYVFPSPDGDGLLCHSADDGALLCWVARLEDASLDASLAEMDRMRQ